jgi:hypothetical protein
MPEGVTLRGSASNSDYNVTDSHVTGSLRQSIPNTSTAAMLHKAAFLNGSTRSQRRDTRQLSVQHPNCLLSNQRNNSNKNNVIMNRIIKGDLTMFENTLVQSHF